MIRAEIIKTELAQVVFTGVLVEILCVASDQTPNPHWLKPTREFISSYNQMVHCGGTFMFCLPQWLFLTPFSDSSPRVVPRRCQNSWIYVNPVLEKQEKAYGAFLIAQSKVLAFSLLVTREHIHAHPWTVARGMGYNDCLSLELEVGFIPPKWHT